MQCCWHARKPGQRTRVGRRERCEPPVEDGRRIVCGSKVASGGGRQQVAEWVLTGFGAGLIHVSRVQPRGPAL
jgi:hypothetical protein